MTKIEALNLICPILENVSTSVNLDQNEIDYLNEWIDKNLELFTSESDIENIILPIKQIISQTKLSKEGFVRISQLVEKIKETNAAHLKNSIKRELMRRLAQAPSIVAQQYISELSGEDKLAAIRLVKALGIKINNDY